MHRGNAKEGGVLATFLGQVWDSGRGASKPSRRWRTPRVAPAALTATGTLLPATHLAFTSFMLLLQDCLFHRLANAHAKCLFHDATYCPGSELPHASARNFSRSVRREKSGRNVQNSRL
jgi:hypothetical protein